MKDFILSVFKILIPTILTPTFTIWITHKINNKQNFGQLHNNIMIERTLHLLTAVVISMPVTLSAFSLVNNDKSSNYTITLLLFCFVSISSIVFILYKIPHITNFFTKKKIVTLAEKQKKSLYNSLTISILLNSFFMLPMFVWASFETAKLPTKEEWMLLCSFLSLFSLFFSGLFSLYCFDKYKTATIKKHINYILLLHASSLHKNQFKVRDTDLSDLVLFALKYGLLRCGTPLHKLLEIHGEDERVIFFTEKTLEQYNHYKKISSK